MSDSSWPHDREGLTNKRNEVTVQRQEQVRSKILTTGEFWTASCKRKFTINKNRKQKTEKKNTFSNIYNRFGVNNFNI